MKLNLNQNWCRLSSPVTRFAKLIENMFNLTFIYIKKGYVRATLCGQRQNCLSATSYLKIPTQSNSVSLLGDRSSSR